MRLHPAVVGAGSHGREDIAKPPGSGHNLPMQEIELKFQIPAGVVGSVSADIERLPGHGRERLQAHYVDTPDRRLGQARSALRLRKEGERWVQTLKAAGTNTMVRLEDNQAVPAPVDGQSVRVDLGLHRGTPAESALVRALGWDPAQDPEGLRTGLVELYRTDIWRHGVRLVVGQGSREAGTVELALDIGHIHAGALNLPVHELEIELIDGHAEAVLDCARDWVGRHALWLDTRTKAHRGDHLARQAAGETPATRLASGASSTDLATCLDRFVDAMSEVSSSEHLPAPQSVADWLATLEALIPVAETQRDRLPTQAVPALRALRQALREPVVPAIALARAPATTLLCLDLFAALV